MHKNRVLNHVEYKLPRQEISEKLSKFCAKKVKENKIYVPATRKNLAKLAKILEKIKEDGLPEYLVLKKLEHNLGHGIFLHPEADPILKGEFIAPYSGKVFLLHVYSTFRFATDNGRAARVESRQCIPSTPPLLRLS